MTRIRSNKIRQVHNFDGITVIRGCYPSDIDGVLDFKGNAFIFLEGKSINAPENRGQDLLYENLCKRLELGGARTIVIVYTVNTDDEVDVANCLVKKKYLNGEWKGPHSILRVEEAIDKTMKFWKRKGIKL